MKIGDRVTVIDEADEYSGLSGHISDITTDGKLVVDVEMPGPKYSIPFDPHAVELETIAKQA